MGRSSLNVVFLTSSDRLGRITDFGNSGGKYGKVRKHAAQTSHEMHLLTLRAPLAWMKLLLDFDFDRFGFAFADLHFFGAS